MRSETVLSQPKLKVGMMLRLYLVLSWAIWPLALWHLGKRLALGKENQRSLKEKRAIITTKRPDGPLIWLHAVGLGEVLALRALILALAHARPRAHFLVTSSAQSSAAVFVNNCPPNCLHQFLPLDLGPFPERFLAHWRPDLAIMAEQEVWPRFQVEIARQNIPLAWVNARISPKSARVKGRFRRFFLNIYRYFDYISVQNKHTASVLKDLGLRDGVGLAPSFKLAAPPLHYDTGLATQFGALLSGRVVICAASTHAEDEQIILPALKKLFKTNSETLVVVTPRDAARGGAVAQMAQSLGLICAQRSLGGKITPQTQIYIADTYGELGLWYHLSARVIMGGSFCAVQGHNPYEALAAGNAVLHGPFVENFQDDYTILDQVGAAQMVTTGDELLFQLQNAPFDKMADVGTKLLAQHSESFTQLAQDLLALNPKRLG